MEKCRWCNLYAAVILDRSNDSIVTSVAYYASTIKEFKEMVDEEFDFLTPDKFKVMYRLVMKGEYK